MKCHSVFHTRICFAKQHVAVLFAGLILVAMALSAAEEPLPAPDAVPPGEAAPWEPPAVPPEGNDPPPAPAPVAPGEPPAPPSPATPVTTIPDDRPIDLSFLDFLVPKNPKPTWHLVGGMEAVATAGVKSAGSRPTVGTDMTELGGAYKQWRFTWKRTDFDWDFNNASVFGPKNGFPTPPASIGHGRDPWQPLTSLSVGWFYFRGYKPRWFYAVGAGVSASFEKEMKDCFSAFVLGQFIHQIEKDWNVNFGLMLAVNRRSVLPLPVIGIVWHKDTASGWSIEIGFPQITLGYRWNERWMVRTRFIEGEGDTFRLADKNPIAPKGTVEFKAARTGFEFEWTPAKNLTVVLGWRYLFSRQWVIRNATQKHKETININSAMGGQVRVEWGF